MSRLNYRNSFNLLYGDIKREEKDNSEVGISFKNSTSSLRKASKSNPRIYPCPTCGEKNRLTLQDVNLGYQCDECADKIEGGF